jgi:hypothetical protein
VDQYGTKWTTFKVRDEIDECEALLMLETYNKTMGEQNDSDN